MVASDLGDGRVEFFDAGGIDGMSRYQRVRGNRSAHASIATLVLTGSPDLPSHTK